MGDYAVASDVESRLSTFNVPAFGAGTDPTLTEVNAFISQYEAEINMVLKAQNYSTIPATGSNDVLMLRRLVAGRVAAEVFDLMFNNTERPATVQTWIDDYRAYLNMLRKGETRLLDQDPAGTASRRMVIGGMTQTSTTWTDSDVTSYE